MTSIGGTQRMMLAWLVEDRTTFDPGYRSHTLRSGAASWMDKVLLSLEKRGFVRGDGRKVERIRITKEGRQALERYDANQAEAKRRRNRRGRP